MKEISRFWPFLPDFSFFLDFSRFSSLFSDFSLVSSIFDNFSAVKGALCPPCPLAPILATPLEVDTMVQPWIKKLVGIPDTLTLIIAIFPVLANETQFRATDFKVVISLPTSSFNFGDLTRF